MVETIYRVVIHWDTTEDEGPTAKIIDKAFELESLDEGGIVVESFSGNAAAYPSITADCLTMETAQKFDKALIRYIKRFKNAYLV